MASHYCSKNVKGSVLGFDLASKGKGARVLYNRGEGGARHGQDKTPNVELSHTLRLSLAEMERRMREGKPKEQEKNEQELALANKAAELARTLGATKRSQEEARKRSEALKKSREIEQARLEVLKKADKATDTIVDRLSSDVVSPSEAFDDENFYQSVKRSKEDTDVRIGRVLGKIDKGPFSPTSLEEDGGVEELSTDDIEFVDENSENNADANENGDWNTAIRNAHERANLEQQEHKEWTAAIGDAHSRALREPSDASHSSALKVPEAVQAPQEKIIPDSVPQTKKGGVLGWFGKSPVGRFLSKIGLFTGAVTAGYNLAPERQGRMTQDVENAAASAKFDPELMVVENVDNGDGYYKSSDKTPEVVIDGPAEPMVKELYETPASNRTPEVIVDWSAKPTITNIPDKRISQNRSDNKGLTFEQAKEASPYSGYKIENPYTDVAQEVSNFDKKKIGNEHKYRTLGGKTVYDNGDGLFEEISGGTVRYGYGSNGRIESIALKYGNTAPVIIGVEPSGKLKRQVASASEWEGRIADMQDTLNRVNLLKGSN
jgi:hypothetical protein